MTYTIKKVEKSLVFKSFEVLNIEIESDTLYILPEYIDENSCFLNQHSINFFKDLKELDIKVKILKKNDYEIYVTKSADVILPLIYGIPFSVFSTIIAEWLKAHYHLGQEKYKTVKVRYYTKDLNGAIESLEIEGTSEDVRKIIKDIQKKGIIK